MAVSKYDPELCERLEREAREDDERMTPAGQWKIDIGVYEDPGGDHDLTFARGPMIDRAECNGVHDWKHRAKRDGAAMLRTRNNLRAMADQLAAARAEIERLQAESDLRGQTVADLAHELGTVKGMRDLERPVVEAAESWREEQIFTLKTPLTDAVDAYRAARDKAGG